MLVQRVEAFLSLGLPHKDKQKAWIFKVMREGRAQGAGLACLCQGKKEGERRHRTVEDAVSGFLWEGL